MNRGDFPEVLGTLSILIPETDDTPFQFELSRNDRYYMYTYDVEPVLKKIEFRVLGSCKTESRYDNYLRLDPSRKDDYGVPEIQIHFSYSEADEHDIRRMIGKTRDLVLAAGGTLSSPICKFLPGQERHYTGTCRIGNDPLTAAANPYGEIFGVSGLFVADNSMIPSVSAANPTLTTVALSIRTADHIVRQFQK